MPDGVEIIHCNGINISAQLKDYYLSVWVNSYNPRAWKENQVFFQSLTQILKKNNKLNKGQGLEKISIYKKEKG